MTCPIFNDFVDYSETKFTNFPSKNYGKVRNGFKKKVGVQSATGFPLEIRAELKVLKIVLLIDQ